MSLQLIYGLSGSGKSEYLLQLADKNRQESDRKVIFIVPEQYSYETEKALAVRLGVISPKTVEVLSFKRLFYYVCNNAGGSVLPKITETGKGILISKAIKKCRAQLKILGKTAAYNGFLEVASTLFSEFKRYNTTPEKINEITDKIEDEYFRQKMQDISLLYGAYEQELEGAFTDPDDELSLLAKILGENKGFFSDSLIFIDQFEGFTPQEMSVIAELSKQADEVKITLCTDTLLKTGDKPSIFSMQIKTAAGISEMTEKYGIETEKPLFLENVHIHKNTPALKHLEKCLREDCYNKFADVPEQIEIMFALNLTSEVARVAEKIIEYTRDKGYRYRDFSIVARNAESYRGVVQSVFERYGLPLYVSDKTPLSEETPAFAILCAFNVINNNWDYKSVFEYLKTGYSNISDEESDLLENYIIKTGIRGNSWKSGKTWKYMPHGFTEKDVEKVNEIRNKICDSLGKLEENVKNARVVRDYITALVDFMRFLELEQKISETAEFYRETQQDVAARYEQIYPMIIAALDDIDGVCGENEEVSAEEFSSMLSAAFEFRTVGIIPTSVDSITFADAERSRASRCKIMFVVGVNDGVFPAVFSGEGIIRDSERQLLESFGLKMAADTTVRTFEEDFVVYATLTHPAEKLYVSYPLSDNSGSSLAPSEIIRKLKSIFPFVAETENVVSDKASVSSIATAENALDIFAVEKSKVRDGYVESPIWEEVGECLKNNPKTSRNLKMIETALGFKNIAEKLTEENLTKLYSDEVYTSVSRLEAYRSCPFMYYVKYILKANPRETTELRSVETGTIMHAVVEQISLKVKNEFGSWNEVTDLWIEENVEAISEKEMVKLKESLDIVEPRQIWAFYRMKEAVKASALIIAKQLQSGEFVPMGYEISFDDDSKYGCIEFPVCGKKVKLRGKIDRSDIYTDENGKKYIRVIDYKSGKKEFEIEKLYYGMNLQLAVYLDSLTTHENAVCAGMLYFRLFDPIASVEKDVDSKIAKQALEKERKTNGLLLADADIVKKMDRGLENGNDTYLPVRFKKDGSFYSGSKIAGYEQFEAMNNYVRKTVKKMSEQLLCGNNSISPYKLGDETPCKFCEYKKICHFDESNNYNYLTKISSDEAWEKITEEVTDDAAMDS